MQTPLPAPSDGDKTDQAAIMLMLAYVEAECRRLGADAAARYAAMAASLLPGRGAPPGSTLH
ncbi:hypothetical protein [Falsiroseomonas stagni]|uniref:Uncharacterized protein n=1 Tax=Falsiroseomonas stagni DSM 19981 TaxID=1123062 RepID=A0A1I3XMD5_9PROT|nr:hypothetical protein [Falsiroseomonas stagni]SFK20690.1 hypothetical protein SAMN02745775_101463 [Falsiroseomonas stagni DSM 19981]